MQINDLFGAAAAFETVRMPDGTEAAIPTEHAAVIYVNEQPAFRVVCTPQLLPQLALGRLLTEGWIASAEEVEQISVCAEGLKVNIYLNHPLTARRAAAQEVSSCCTDNVALGSPVEVQPLRAVPQQVGECLAATGIGFMFAPNHHPAMKNVAPVRREMGVRTLFNILGPLTNPAGAPNTLLGVFHPDLVGILVRVMERLGAKHVLVVHGKDGMDEVSLGAATLVGELKDGEVREYEIHPEDYGLQMQSLRQLRVGCIQLWRLMTNVVECTFQFYAADRAFSGNKARRVVTGSEDDLVVLERRRDDIGGRIGCGLERVDDRISGHDEAAGVGIGSHGKQGCSAEQTKTGHGVTPLGKSIERGRGA